MLKAKTVVGLLGLALSFSFLVLCVMTFAVLPDDVLRKSSFHRTRGLLPSGQRTGGASSRQKINSLLRSNNAAGRFAIRHVGNIDVDGEVSPEARKSTTSSSFRVEDGHRNNREDKVKKELLLTGERHSGIHTIRQGEFPLLRVRPDVSASDDGRVDGDLLVKTLRDHGMHPERARALASTLLGLQIPASNPHRKATDKTTTDEAYIKRSHQPVPFGNASCTHQSMILSRDILRGWTLSHFMRKTSLSSIEIL